MIGNGTQDFTLSVNDGPAFQYIDVPLVTIDAQSGNDSITVDAFGGDWDISITVLGGLPSSSDTLNVSTPGTPRCASWLNIEYSARTYGETE